MNQTLNYLISLLMVFGNKVLSRFVQQDILFAKGKLAHGADDNSMTISGKIGKGTKSRKWYLVDAFDIRRYISNLGSLKNMLYTIKPSDCGGIALNGYYIKYVIDFDGFNYKVQHSIFKSYIYDEVNQQTHTYYSNDHGDLKTFIADIKEKRNQA
jgi:hypothetical protein